jgi:hypothetical protein
VSHTAPVSQVFVAEIVMAVKWEEIGRKGMINELGYRLLLNFPVLLRGCPGNTHLALGDGDARHHRVHAQAKWASGSGLQLGPQLSQLVS